MCAVGSSQDTSIAATTPVGIGGSMRGSGGGSAIGARRVAGGRGRGSLLTGDGGAGRIDSSPTRPGTPYRPSLLTMER